MLAELTRWLTLRGFRHHDAEDAAQEALIIAWKQGDTNPGYVKGIARHKGADVVARNVREREIVQRYAVSNLHVARHGEDTLLVDYEDHLIPMYTNKYRDDVLHGEDYMEKLRRQARERAARKKAHDG